MKNNFRFRFLWMTAFILLFTGVKAQNPVFTVELRNAAQVSTKILEFDIYITNTGVSDFEYASAQYGIKVNPGIKNGGTISAFFVKTDNGQTINNGTTPTPPATTVIQSGLPFARQPNTITFTAAQNCVKVSAKTPAAGTFIPVAPGVQVTRIRLVNTADFTANSTPNFKWSFTVTPYKSDVNAYVGGLNTLVTDTNFYSDQTGNIVLNPIAPVVYNMLPGGSYCQGGAGLPVDVSNSQLSFNYTLYKDGISTGTTLPGTGTALSFGNKTAGIYKVKGNPGNFWMNDSTVITESPSAPVSVAVGVDQNNLCTAVPVTFTATPTNGGTAVYQWYLNGSTTGTNQPTYSYTPANGDVVHVVMTSDVACATGNPATSSNITMVILPTLPASVSVGVDQNNICAGVSSTFTATPTNGGTPTYQWYLGTTPVGTNSPTYSYVPTNGDQVSVVMTSTYQCVTGSPATSSAVTMVVNPILPVSVVAGPDQNNICAGTSVTFTATPTNGGTPTYQWYLNGFPIGTNSPTYTFVPSNLDQVSVVMTSSNACVSGNPATSGSTAMIVDPCTGIETNLMDVTSLYVYPNPSSDRLYVNFNELKETPNSMKLFNSLGQVCFESNMPLQTNQNGIDVSQLSAGSYTLQIMFDNGTVNKKVVVKK
jgi:hypothetical protein